LGIFFAKSEIGNLTCPASVRRYLGIGAVCISEGGTAHRPSPTDIVWSVYREGTQARPYRLMRG